MKHGKVNKSVFRGFFLNQILGKRRFLSYVFNFYAEESRLIPDELHWVFDLRWSSWNKRQNSGFGVLAVGFARDSLQDFRRWITYTVFERGLAICVQKKMLPKVERRAEGSERDRERPRTSENQATVKLQARNVIAVLTCPFQLHTEEKALLCDWKGHVVNLPIWTWVLFSILASSEFRTIVACRHVATTLCLFLKLKRWALNGKPGFPLVISGKKKSDINSQLRATSTNLFGATVLNINFSCYIVHNDNTTKCRLWIFFYKFTLPLTLNLNVLNL